MLYLDVETSYTSDPRPVNPNAYLSLVTAIDDNLTPYHWVFRHHEVERGCEKDKVANLQRLIDAHNGIVACHNAKFDVAWLHFIGVDVMSDKFKPYCSMVAEYLISGHVHNTGTKDALSLNGVAERYGFDQKIDEVQALWENGVETADIPLDMLKKYAVRDVSICRDITHKTKVQLKEMGLVQVFRLKMRELKVLVDVESNGFLVDSDENARLTKYFREEIERVKAEIFKVSGRRFDLNSYQQLSAFLYGGEYQVGARVWFMREYKKGLKLVSKKDKVTKSFPRQFVPLDGTELKSPGYWATDISTLKELKPQNKEQEELLDNLQYLSQCQQQLGTFCENIPPLMINGCVHSQFNTAQTGTGRLSSSKPNLQNQSRGTTSETRKMFVSRFN